MKYRLRHRSTKAQLEKYREQFKFKQSAVVAVSPPQRNPYMTEEADRKLNPVRIYRATIFDWQGVPHVLTGTVFGNQTVEERVRHHALMRGLGDVKVISVREQPDERVHLWVGA